ncbi:MAG: hypothetical protein ACAH17_03750 [Candidatus Paceibacterota bacterium]
MFDNNNDMERRWEDLMKACGLKKFGEDLRMVALAYADPIRKYHTLDHIRFCVQELDKLQAYVVRPELVELAIWYHDVVYVPGASDNEAKSAEMFEVFAQKARLRRADKAFVMATILSTTHKAEDRRRYPDTSFMLDIDLLSLAKPEVEFDVDSRACRKEFKHLTAKEYWPRNKAFLKSLLDRGYIYCTEAVHDRYEQAAQRNLRRLVDCR